MSPFSSLSVGLDAAGSGALHVARPTLNSTGLGIREEGRHQFRTDLCEMQRVIQAPKGFHPEARSHRGRDRNAQVGPSLQLMGLLAGCWPTDSPQGPGEADR